MYIVINNEKLNIHKIIYKGKIKIFEHNNNKYVYKEKNRNYNNNVYDYLETRNFNYYPSIIEENDNYVISQFIEDYDIPLDQKILDMIDLVSLLHSKTVQYKNVTEDIYKELYESILNKINNLNNYYEKKIEEIETKIFMSPFEYLLAKNISKIFGSLSYCRYSLDEWFEKVKNNKQIRYVLNHNNLSIDHFLKNKSSYLINWNKSNIDIPIYDLYGLYLNHGIDFEFENILKHYEKTFPLLEEEKLLFLVFISLPNRLNEDSSEYSKCMYLNKYLEFIKKSENLVLKYNSDKRKNS